MGSYAHVKQIFKQKCPHFSDHDLQILNQEKGTEKKFKGNLN